MFISKKPFPNSGIKWGALLFLVALNWQCARTVQVDDIENMPAPTPADEAFANVYSSLDGHWKGQFFIFQPKAVEVRNDEILYNLDRSIVQSNKLAIVNSLVVDQFYESESPYFQKVKIIDVYPETGEKVESLGVNKVQDGKMWCVVRKPDETIIHKGSMAGSNTIIWQRTEENPQRVEYFKETVLPNSYEIIGWGYYEGDDLSKMPRNWFYAQYQRSAEGQ